MAKRPNTEAEETIQETSVAPAEDNAEETVTVSRDEFEAMKAQMNLLTKQMTSEQRYKSADEKKAEEEAALLEQVKRANEEAMEEVECYIDKGSLRSNKNAEVAINGVQYVIPKGQTVRIPRCVKEIIDNSERQRDAAFGIQEEKNSEFETAFASGALTDS